MQDSDWSLNSDPVNEETIAFWETVKNTASEVDEHLFISGYPEGSLLDFIEEKNIKLIVSTTLKEPPKIETAKVVRMPLSDDFEALPDFDKIIEAAELAAWYIRRKQNVLVHCLYGLNRSSLVAGFILALLHRDWQGKEILDLIREKRVGALHNSLFADIVSSLNEQ